MFLQNPEGLQQKFFQNCARIFCKNTYKNFLSSVVKYKLIRYFFRDSFRNFFQKILSEISLEISAKLCLLDSCDDLRRYTNRYSSSNPQRCLQKVLHKLLQEFLSDLWNSFWSLCKVFFRNCRSDICFKFFQKKTQGTFLRNPPEVSLEILPFILWKIHPQKPSEISPWVSPMIPSWFPAGICP